TTHPPACPPLFPYTTLFRSQRPGMHIQNTLQTNGTMLDDEWCSFFREHHFLIGLSLDGPGAMHDAYRVDKGGKPTFDRVMEGVRSEEHTSELQSLAYLVCRL